MFTFLVLFIFLQHLSHVWPEYAPGERYGSALYYTLQEDCQDLRTDGEIYGEDDNIETLKQDGRFLSLTRQTKDGSDGVVNSTTLEVYILKNSMDPIKIYAPNLKSISVIDTPNLRWGIDGWNFPLLRVINLITVKTESEIELTSLGSSNLEILRIRRAEYSKMRLKYTPQFANLRLLEIGQLGSAVFYGVCEFIIRLTSLEIIMLNRIEEPCIARALKVLWAKAERLKIIRIFNSDHFVPEKQLCSVLPPGVEHLRMAWSNGLKNTSVYNCFPKLKSLTVRVRADVLEEISSNIRSIRISSDVRRFNSTSQLPINLENSIVVSLDNLYIRIHSIPALPNAELVQFTRNGFNFVPGVEPFPYIPKVRALDLSSNPITHVPAGMFKRTPLLGILVLQQTKIHSFHDRAFCDLQWPRALVLQSSFPSDVRMFTVPGESRAGQNWSTFSCLTQSYKITNLVIDGLDCSCDKKAYQYLDRKTIRKHLGLDVMQCSDQGIPTSDFYEGECPDQPTTQIVEALPPTSPYICYPGVLAGLCLWWLIFLLFCLVPPPILYHFHRVEMKKQLRLNQAHTPKVGLFIICPRHARQWCKRVVIPCLEADQFRNPEPRLRQSRPDRPRPSMEEQENQHAIQVPGGNVKPPACVHAVRSTTLSSPSGSVLSASHSETVDSSLLDTAPMHGPWAWQPRFTCHLAPPARHRLTLLMESKQVLIIFPSASLFSEPACRAQLRLAFHLCRLHMIPPPGIIVWPTNHIKSNLPGNYRSINRNRNIADHNKYYPAPTFNSVTNEPDDIAELAVIKAKVPTREEAIHIMQYFATITSPCIEWCNWKTAQHNLRPFVWLFNKASRVPAY